MTALCECGCGRQTSPATQTRPEYGHVKGQPVRFIAGHQDGTPLHERVDAGWLERHYTGRRLSAAEIGRMLECSGKTVKGALRRLGIPLRRRGRRKCSVDGCERESHARSWCALHHRRWQKHGDPLAKPGAPPAVAPGERFGRLLVLEVAGTRDHTRRYWCKCDCWNLIAVRGSNLGRFTNSCGCLHRETISTHGKTRTPAWHSWAGMLQRCRNPRTPGYRHYGARDVKVYERWDPQQGGSFENFLADLGERPEGTTLGRFGDTGNYEPGNVAWQTAEEQLANRKTKKEATP